MPRTSPGNSERFTSAPYTRQRLPSSLTQALSAFSSARTTEIPPRVRAATRVKESWRSRLVFIASFDMLTSEPFNPFAGVAFFHSRSALPELCRAQSSPGPAASPTSLTMPHLLQSSANEVGVIACYHQ